MSQENVELCREVYARFRAGDTGWEEFIHPEIEWDFSAYPLADIPTRGRGREAVIREVIVPYYSGWLDYQAEITEMADAGDDIVVVQHEVTRLRESDAVLERDIFYIWTVRERQWVHWRAFPSRGAALEAAGLSE